MVLEDGQKANELRKLRVYEFNTMMQVIILGAGLKGAKPLQLLEDRLCATGRASLLDRPPQRVLGVVQPRSGEPLGAGHTALAKDGLVRLRCSHLAELPHRGPEVLDLRHRPAPQRVVVRELQPSGPAHVFREAGQGSVGIRSRLPQRYGVRRCVG